MIVALSLSSILAAGTVVDLTVRGEGRASQLSEPVADGFSNTLLLGGVTPAVRVAHQGQALFLDTSYAPNLSLIWPSADIAVVMHRFNGQANWNPSPKLRLSADASGAIGDLDAGAAVRDIGNSRAQALVGGGNLTQFPFADIIGGIDVGYRHDGRWTWTGGLRLEVTGSPSPGEEELALLPPQIRPDANVGATYLLSGTDSLTGNVALRSAFLGDDRGVIGKGGWLQSTAPTLAWNHTLMNNVVVSGRGGWMFAFVDEGLRRNVLAHGLPIVDGRMQASVNLSGEAAIEGAVVLGMAPFSDPLGGLLEQRISGGVQGAWRLNRDLTFTTAATAFGTMYAVGGNAVIAEESNTAVGGSFGVAYNLTEWVAFNAEAIGNSRVITDKFGRLTELRPEVTVAVGFIGALNLFHRGERPPGTDPRPGRSVGTRPVSLPGSSRAFSGRSPTASTQRSGSFQSTPGASSSSTGSSLQLQAEQLLERRRRGMSADERRLLKRAAAEKRSQEEKREAALKKQKAQTKDPVRKPPAEKPGDKDKGDKRKKAKSPPLTPAKPLAPSSSAPPPKSP
jgi:hypothetical protein